MMKPSRLLAAGLVVALIHICMGCTDNGFSPEPTRDDLLSEGWAEFEAGDFVSARGAFEDAALKDPGCCEAFAGEGWCCLKLDSLVTAIACFDEALARGDSTADPHAGKAFARRDLMPVDFTSVVESAQTALGIELRYSFIHDPSADWRHLRLTLAHSYFALGDYGAAKTQVDSLDPGNGLDPASGSFIEDLLGEIQSLGDL